MWTGNSTIILCTGVVIGPMPSVLSKRSLLRLRVTTVWTYDPVNFPPPQRRALLLNRVAASETLDPFHPGEDDENNHAVMVDYDTLSL